jgi:hypothetical protein
MFEYFVPTFIRWVTEQSVCLFYFLCTVAKFPFFTKFVKGTESRDEIFCWTAFKILAILNIPVTLVFKFLGYLVEEKNKF